MKHRVARDRAALQYRRGAAAGFVDSLAQRGRVGFALTELMRATGLSTIAARRQLARLGPKVTRVRPREEFFLIVGPEHRVLGAPPPTWWLDEYFRWLQRPYYLALQSAAAEFGVAAQAVQVTQVITDRPRREIRLGRVRVHFFVKRSISRIPTQQLAGGHAPLTIGTPEATVIDLVRYADRIGGISRAAETIAPLLPRLRRGQLAGALDGDIGTPTAQRLGYLLGVLGKPRLADTVSARLPPTLSRVLLDHAAQLPPPSEIEIDGRWAVVVNATVERQP